MIMITIPVHMYCILEEIFIHVPTIVIKTYIMKKKAVVKKNKGSYAAAAKVSGLSGGTKKTSMKSGGSMGKCKYGCN